MIVLRAAAVSFVALAACTVGEVPTGNPGVDARGPTTDASTVDGPGAAIDAPPAVDPAMAFETTIKPILGMYGCGGCHPVQSKPDLSSYAKLSADAAKYLGHPGSNSLLVKQGVHASLTMYFSDAQKKVIGDWIDTIHP